MNYAGRSLPNGKTVNPSELMPKFAVKKAPPRKQSVASQIHDVFGAIMRRQSQR